MRRTVWLVSLFGVCLSVVVLSPMAWADQNDDGAFFADTNAERAKVGAQPLRMAADLVAVARKQAGAMAGDGRIYHNPTIGTDVQNWKTVAENVGRGADEPQIQGLLMGSPGHRANILNGAFSEIGIATVRAGDYLYVAEVFRQPMAAAAPAPASVPRPAPAPRLSPAVVAPPPPPAVPAPASPTTSAVVVPQVRAVAVDSEPVVFTRPPAGSRPNGVVLLLATVWTLFVLVVIIRQLPSLPLRLPGWASTR
jgi:hypothetical protein